MNKKEFLGELRSRLGNLPESEIRKSTLYYSEMIDDRVEDGMSEAEAVAALGSMDEIVRAAVGDMSLPTLVRARIDNSEKPRSGAKNALIIAGSPIWVPILIAIIAVVFSIYITVWAVVLAFAVTVAAFVISLIPGIAVAVLRIIGGEMAAGICTLGLSMILSGAGLLLIRPLVHLVRFVARTTSLLMRLVKVSFVGGGK